MNRGNDVKQRPEEDTSRSRDSSLERDDELPAYQDSTTSNLYAPSNTASPHNVLGPSISSPFNFPSTSQAPPPDYSPASTSQRTIAIPQQFPGAAAPFLAAYPPVLLNHGIPAESWYSFVDTMSAFLTARVGKRAVSHAGDIAASLGGVPKRLGKDVADHVKGTFKNIGHQAKSMNPIGLVGSVVGGTISLTVGTAAKVVGSTLSLPGTAIGAGVNVKTPRERAEAYAAAANKDWFHKRGLHAELLNTRELAVVLGVSAEQILNSTSQQSMSPTDQMRTLQDLIESVDIRSSGKETATQEVHAQQELSPSGYPADNKRSHEPETQSEAGPSGSSSSQSQPTPSTGAPGALHLSAQSLWLVLLRDEPSKKN